MKSVTITKTTNSNAFLVKISCECGTERHTETGVTISQYRHVISFDHKAKVELSCSFCGKRFEMERSENESEFIVKDAERRQPGNPQI